MSHRSTDALPNSGSTMLVLLLHSSGGDARLDYRFECECRGGERLTEGLCCHAAAAVMDKINGHCAASLDTVGQNRDDDVKWTCCVGESCCRHVTRDNCQNETWHDRLRA